MTRDVKMYETGNGGDIMIIGNDLESCFSFENMPYLGMFGGNVEQVTSQVGQNDEQRFDYWGNAFQNENSQLNSITENRLITTPLTSEGRTLIENAVKSDLSFMKAFAVISVVVRIISDDWLNISILVQEPSNTQSLEFQFIWDAAKGMFKADDNYVAPNYPVDGQYRITQNNIIRALMNGQLRSIN